MRPILKYSLLIFVFLFVHILNFVWHFKFAKYSWRENYAEVKAWWDEIGEHDDYCHY